MIAELEQTRAELALRMAELERLNAEVVALSRTDPLTGIANRRMLLELGQLAGRHEAPTAVAVVDVDRFKDINDRYGHGIGDDVLVVLAGLLRQRLRTVDVPARLGGDEFVILMPSIDPAEALAACERLRAAVSAHPWEHVASALRVTITVGVSVGDAEPEELLRRADVALYQGKRSGRDTVVCSPAGSGRISPG
jgi:diguanylate cyclase (GGDEF)-like protein